MRPPAPHRATTAQLQSLYPFVSPGGLRAAGPLLGRDLLGGPFCFDPWDLYRRGALTNPNVLVVGQVGRGKSTFVKTYVWRQLAFGRHAWIVDPKGEYGALAVASGSRPLRLAPGGDFRLNPLDVATSRSGAELVDSIVSSSLGRSLRPAERTATELALRASQRSGRAPGLGDVVSALLDPDPSLAELVRTDSESLAKDGREVALELRRLIEGDLAGLFDAESTSGLEVDSPVVVIDLSAVFASRALPVLMTCATGWLQALLARADGLKRLLVIDEAWAVLHDLATARWLQASFKLSRSLGVAGVAVVHRLSDLRAAGSAGSAEERLAEGLLADTETRVIFGQPRSELHAHGHLLQLTESEREVVGGLPRGVALWKVGNRSFVVEHRVGSEERSLVDTDAAMREAPSG